MPSKEQAAYETWMAQRDEEALHGRAEAADRMNERQGMDLECLVTNLAAAVARAEEAERQLAEVRRLTQTWQNRAVEEAKRNLANGHARKAAELKLVAATQAREAAEAQVGAMRKALLQAAEWLESRPDYTEGDAAVSSMCRAALAASQPERKEEGR